MIKKPKLINKSTQFKIKIGMDYYIGEGKQRVMVIQTSALSNETYVVLIIEDLKVSSKH